MPLPPKKRRRPYLKRQAKRLRIDVETEPPPPPPLPPSPPSPSSPPPTTTSSTTPSPTPPPSPPPTPPQTPSLESLSEDIFLRIITILQQGPILRGPVLQSARHAFPLALVSTALHARYQASLHIIDAAAAFERDPAAPALLREHLPPHIRNLVTIAGPHLRALRLPRYEHSQIGAEAVLPVIRHCTHLSELSFVDCGRVDKTLTRSIFGPSLEVVAIERPSPKVVESLARCRAALRVVDISGIPFSATDRVVEMLKSRGGCMERVSLRFDGRSVQVVEDSGEKAGETSTSAELRRFLGVVYEHLEEWVPRLREIEVTCSDQRDLEHTLVNAGKMLQRGLVEVTNTVNALREKSGVQKRPTDLRVVSLCWRTLPAIPRLFRIGEVRVRLPGYELRYNGRGKEAVKPCLWHFQMTSALRRLEIPDLWRLTGGIDTLNIGDEETVRSFKRMKEDFRVLIANARSLRRVIVRLGISDTDFACRVMKYVTKVLRIAPWVREVEISHEVVLYHDRPEFADMIQAMSMLQVIHLNAPTECLRGCGKGRLTGFARHLPKVLRLFAEFCKRLEVLYCERIGEARVISGEKTREELIRKLGEIDVVIEARLSKVDCTSLKALVVAWVEQIKHE